MRMLEAVEKVVDSNVPLLGNDAVTVDTSFLVCDFISEIRRKKRLEERQYRNVLNSYRRYGEWHTR